MEAMWCLVKEGSLSRQQIASLDFGSKATIGTMRNKKRELESANKPQLLNMCWEDARKWTSDGEQEVQKLVEQLVATGVVEAYGKPPCCSRGALPA
jgi:hypothetical protein